MVQTVFPAARAAGAVTEFQFGVAYVRPAADTADMPGSHGAGGSLLHLLALRFLGLAVEFVTAERLTDTLGRPSDQQEENKEPDRFLRLADTWTVLRLRPDD